MTKKKRKTKYPRHENELPAGKLSLIGELSYGPEYIERGGEYFFTEKAFQRLLLLKLEASPPAEAGTVGETTAGAVPTSAGQTAPALSRFGTVPCCGADEEQTVKMLHKTQNKTLIIAVSDYYPGEKYHVRVGDSANFVPGMPMSVVPHPQAPAFWQCVGGIPRYNGRW